MTMQDDRTSDQKRTHILAWVGTDPGMSGWGGATGGMSYAGWAFESGYQNACESFVRQRGDMKRVRLVDLRTYRPNAAHTHIYVWKDYRTVIPLLIAD